MTGKPSKGGQISSLTQNLLQGNAGQMTKAEAFQKGTNIRKAIRLQGKYVRLYLLAELETCLQMVDAATTMQSNQEKLLAVDVLIEEFPAFTVEEFHLLFRDVMKGRWQLYNRLKLAELMQCARDWEGQRAEQILEQQHRPGYDPHRRHSADTSKRKHLALTPADLIEIERIQTKQGRTGGASAQGSSGSYGPDSQT